MAVKFNAPVVLVDTLNNLMPMSGATEEYNKGIVVGIVGCLMAQGLTFLQAADVVACYLNNGANLHAPEGWKAEIAKGMVQRGKVWRQAV